MEHLLFCFDDLFNNHCSVVMVVVVRVVKVVIRAVEM